VTKFDDLQSQWNEKRRLREMVGIVSKERLNGLLGKQSSGKLSFGQSVQQSSNMLIHRAFDFTARNQSMEPSSS